MMQILYSLGFFTSQTPMSIEDWTDGLSWKLKVRDQSQFSENVFHNGRNKQAIIPGWGKLRNFGLSKNGIHVLVSVVVNRTSKPILLFMATLVCIDYFRAVPFGGTQSHIGRLAINQSIQGAVTWLIDGLESSDWLKLDWLIALMIAVLIYVKLRPSSPMSTEPCRINLFPDMPMKADYVCCSQDQAYPRPRWLAGRACMY